MLIFVVIDQTRMKVFHWDIQTSRRELKTQSTAEYFYQIRNVWIAAETLSRAFDKSYQSKQKIRYGNGEIKSSKSMLIKDGVSKSLLRFYFSLF